MAERKLVVVHDNGILHELGGIGGPITTPTRIPIDAILKMINNKRHVWECYPNDPRNPDLRVQLTQANYKSDNFKKTDVKPADEVLETPEVKAQEAPVADGDVKEQDKQVETVQEPTEQDHTNDVKPADEVLETPEVKAQEAPVADGDVKEQDKQVETKEQSKTGNKSKKKK